MPEHPLRYPGLRWALYYGEYTGIEQFAVDELQAFAQYYLPYVIECRPALAPLNTAPEHQILVGTPRNNPHLAALIASGRLAGPAGREGFSLAVIPGSKPGEPKIIAIAGHDPKGVLNGVVDFCARAAGRQELCGFTMRDLRQAFDSIGNLDHRDAAGPGQNSLGPLVAAAAPAIEHRGIWTWGYVISDYRGFLDNMARLKMNMLVIWNDAPPLNSREIIAHARQRGISMIAGFHWGWGIEKISLTNPDHLRQVKQQVLDNYELNYKELGFDGIYFQTATEHTELSIDGRTVAGAACDWVNDIGRALLARHPDLMIQFGLHATSIMGNYKDLAPLDERIQIIWEDAGVTPYSYTPKLALPPHLYLSRQGVGTIEGTRDYSVKLASFRGASGFGLCPKGWSNLDWGNEFEHHQAFIMGRRSPAAIRQRLNEKAAWWNRINQLWLPCYDAQAVFYREIGSHCTGPITSVGLVEDGMFEARIQPSVAVFAETLWNPDRPTADLVELGHSHYYNMTV